MKKIFVAALTAVLLASCTTYQYTARQTNVQRQDITTMPTVVDIRTDYTKRVNTVSNWHPKKEDAINEARYIAVITNNIDVIVDPVFKIQYRPYKAFRKYQVTLTGYAGYYTNPRTVYEDMTQLKNYSREDIENYLLFHNPTVLQYLHATADVVNIYHENGHQPQPSASKEDQQTPQPASTQTSSKTQDKTKQKRK